MRLLSLPKHRFLKVFMHASQLLQKPFLKSTSNTKSAVSLMKSLSSTLTPLGEFETPGSTEIPAAAVTNGFRSVREPGGEMVSAGNISR